MGKSIFYLALFTLVMGCDRKEKTDVLPDYQEWYALKAPGTGSIVASFGDIENTLLIATRYRVYLTKDRGKTWTETKLVSNSFDLYGFSAVGDTLVALTESWRKTGDSARYAVRPRLYSIDGGKNWEIYADRNPRFPEKGVKQSLNQVTTPSGVGYAIKVDLTVNAGVAYVETVGIAGTNNELLTLPQRHQIHSIRLDSKNRLYVSGSAAVCGTLQDFKYCGDENGVLYVSKKPLP